MIEMNLLQIITEHAKRTPNKVALLNEKEQVTYAQLEKMINKTANALISCGVKKGDRVLMQIGNRFEFVYCYFATMKIGAIIVPVNPLYTPNEMQFISSDSSPTVYICEKTAKQNVQTVQANSSHLKEVFVLDEPTS